MKAEFLGYVLEPDTKGNKTTENSNKTKPDQQINEVKANRKQTVAISINFVLGFFSGFGAS